MCFANEVMSMSQDVTCACIQMTNATNNVLFRACLATECSCHRVAEGMPLRLAAPLVPGVPRLALT